MTYPRVLIVSNNSFSLEGSNGRTLASLFGMWDSKCIAQFYIHNEIPDFTICKNYYRVTDNEVKNSIFCRSKVGNKINEKNIEIDIKNNSKRIYENMTGNFIEKKINRTPLTMMIRNFIWNLNLWKNYEYENWLNNFNPEIILLQSGDSTFMLRIATDIAKRFKVPLIIYNSESYYFNKKNYMDNKILSKVFYPLFLMLYKKQFKKTINYSSYSIYICNKLQDAYKIEFSDKSITLMTTTNIEGDNFLKKRNKKQIISYIGNLGIGRDESLIEIGYTLQRIDKNLFLDVYGRVPNFFIKNKMEKCPGIRLRGFIPYEKVKKIVIKSNILVHAENFSKFYEQSLQYAFSTKIADSLASGVCFFVYAPENMAISEYLKKNNAACVVSKKSNLESALKNVIESENYRNELISNARKLAINNHNNKKNQKIFKQIIEDVVECKDVITK